MTERERPENLEEIVSDFGARIPHRLIQELAKTSYLVIPDTSVLQPADKERLKKLIRKPFDEHAPYQPYDDGMKDCIELQNVISVPEVVVEMRGMENHFRSNAGITYNRHRSGRHNLQRLKERGKYKIPEFRKRYEENERNCRAAIRSIEDFVQDMEENAPETECPPLYKTMQDFSVSVSKAAKLKTEKGKRIKRTDEALFSHALYYAAAEGKKSAIVTADNDLSNIYRSVLACLREKDSRGAMAELLEGNPVAVVLLRWNRIETLSTESEIPRLGKRGNRFLHPGEIYEKGKKVEEKAEELTEALEEKAQARKTYAS